MVEDVSRHGEGHHEQYHDGREVAQVSLDRAFHRYLTWARGGPVGADRLVRGGWVSQGTLGSSGGRRSPGGSVGWLATSGATA